ncbi:MAG: HD-GYP domain-containing protein [Firmicutes bacterium]|nr:HD-GYP domain-containing protein [Bacillota bacterium]
MKELERSYQGLMMSLVAALEGRDHQAQGHARRVVAYSQAIADRLGLSTEERRNLVFGAYLHDVGKLGVDDALLQKPASLSEAEWEEMRRHPTIGVQILQGVEFFLKGAMDVILCHHERYDGKGYPLGLAGEDIPLLARIFTVADSFDAMTADRPYRGALMLEEAREIIREEAGKQFCPRCVEAFLSFSCEELAFFRKLAEEDHLAYLGEANGSFFKGLLARAETR